MLCAERKILHTPCEHPDVVKCSAAPNQFFIKEARWKEFKATVIEFSLKSHAATFSLQMQYAGFEHNSKLVFFCSQNINKYQVDFNKLCFYYCYPSLTFVSADACFNFNKASYSSCIFYITFFNANKSTLCSVCTTSIIDNISKWAEGHSRNRTRNQDIILEAASSGSLI